MSPPRKNSPTAEEKLQRIHDLESDLHAAVHAAGVAWDLIETLFDNSQPAELVGGRKDLHSLDPGRVERLHYAVAESWAKARKLESDLLAGLGYSA